MESRRAGHYAGNGFATPQAGQGVGGSRLNSGASATLRPDRWDGAPGSTTESPLVVCPRPIYDLVILGSGVAACAAAVFGATEGLSILLLVRKGSLGVDASRTHLHSHESVAEAKTFGVEVLVGDDPVGVRVEGRHRVLSLDSGQDLVAHAILIASEISVRNLPVPGADRLLGFGVRYGDDLTESMPFEDAEVFVVGGANAAVQAAFLFARCARQVTLLVRGESVTGLSSQTSASRLQLAPNIEVQLRTEVRECLGTEKLTGLLLRSNVTWEEWTVADRKSVV